jgi:hypothetical protein
MLRWMCGVIRIDRIRNDYIRESLELAPVTEKMRSNRLALYGHVMRRDEGHCDMVIGSVIFPWANSCTSFQI